MGTLEEDHLRFCRIIPQETYLEYIDVIQCHLFDMNVEIPVAKKALDVVRSGMSRYIGIPSH